MSERSKKNAVVLMTACWSCGHY